ncbi:trypsin-like peptidase domain-containing protein [Leptospira adleri]|uniref:trypsin-like peptidase domain-containing protein n=1 Tax=Leptospira adleri TaxID=2023186 RepID=UPI001082975F|nr:trypsin-like peptidase domain-containing protein [Leptospira adleri]TGM61560.1 serine protease [Leptospira adleri]
MKNNFLILRYLLVFFIFLNVFQFCRHSSPRTNSPRIEDTNDSNPLSKDRIKIHHIYEEVYPDSSESSVRITSEKNANPQFAHFKGTSKTQKVEVVLGTGIVINQLGYILTNEHVIRSYNKLNVKLKSGKLYEAQIIGLDKKLDLAILKVEADHEIIPVEVLDSYSLQIVERAIEKYMKAKQTFKENREIAAKRNVPVHLRH